MDIKNAPYRLCFNQAVGDTGDTLFEISIPQTMLKHSHYKVMLKYIISMNQQRSSANPYGANWNSRPSAIFLETNLVPYRELDWDKAGFTSMTKQSENQAFIESPIYDEYIFVDKLPPVITGRIWDQVNKRYITNDNILDIAGVFWFFPMTPEDETMGGNNMNRFVGATGYPGRAL